MNKFKFQNCAALLYRARKSGFKLHEIPSPLRPNSLEEAYLIQEQLATLLDGRKIGVKLANTNATSQQFLNLFEPFYGPLLESSRVGVIGTKTKPAPIRVTDLNLRLCEPEFAFLIGENNNIIAAAPAIEIVHTSFLNWKAVGAPSLISDLACNGAWVRGIEVPISQVKLDSCNLIVNRKQFSRGSISRVLNEKNRSPLLFEIRPEWGVKPGDWITTGVCVDPPYHYCEEGDVIVADFSGGLGEVAIECI